MTNVLIPTDFSENAWNATKYAMQFFKEEPVSFYLLHVRFNPGLYPRENAIAQGVTIAQTSSSSETETKLNEVIGKIETLFPNGHHKHYPVLELGLFVDAIKKTISERNIDFIVMGTKGASGLKEVTIGSRTGEVISRVKCPVLIVPENAEFTPTRQIVFPTDFNLHFKQKVLLTLSEVAAMHKASVNVLHCTKSDKPMSEQQQVNRDALEDFLYDIPHSFHFIDGQPIEEVLESFVDVMRIDMIAMVAKNINFFQRLLYTPKVNRISYHTKIPFLVLHE